MTLTFSLYSILTNCLKYNFLSFFLYVIISLCHNFPFLKILIKMGLLSESKILAIFSTPNTTPNTGYKVTNK